MSPIISGIEKHYYKQGLYEDILHRLIESSVDLNQVKRSDITGVDEFHVRGAAVSKELAESMHLNGQEVLDVGCGLGGPCRMLADEYNCNVTGIDLSNEYIRTAKALSKLVKLDDKTRFIVGDATDLQFDDYSFDMVWTQHVQMNIQDKQKFYSEIKRVLRPGGLFMYYDIFKGNNELVEYPMPWASTSQQSFLFRSCDMNDILISMGLKQKMATDQTKKGMSFFEGLLARIKEFGPPKLGLNVIMGESTKPKLLNLLGHLKNGALMLESGVYITK